MQSKVEKIHDTYKPRTLETLHMQFVRSLLLSTVYIQTRQDKTRHAIRSMQQL